MTKTLINENMIDAREAKNNFGALIDAAQRRPIIIRKHGRKVAVMLSPEEFALFERMEDIVWGKKAMAALKKNDFLGPAASKRVLDKYRNAA
ncbi:MAG: type II toxin-antitoxin system Phd/YefM family antitoxin [bacterium]